MTGFSTPCTGVVVGVDGTESAERALLWAAREAALRRCALVVTHAYRHLGWPGGPEVDRANRRRARNLVRAAADLAAAAQPNLVIVPQVVRGTPVQALESAVDLPDLLVVGQRHRGRVAGALLAGTGSGLARRSPRPVVVVPEPDGRPGPFAGHVVVGVDHSVQSGTVLAFAFAAAASRGRPLAVVHVGLGWNTDTWRELDSGELHQESPEEGWLLLEAAVRPFRALYPRLPVKLVLHQAPAAAGLLRAARGADLLVVGTAGRGRVASATGSVSRAMIARASCPVAVIPPAPAVTLPAYPELDRLTAR